LWQNRLWWIGVFLTCLGIAIYLTADTIIEYSENPILNSFREEEPIYKFPFAGISVTGTMIFRDNVFDALDK